MGVALKIKRSEGQTAGFGLVPKSCKPPRSPSSALLPFFWRVGILILTSLLEDLVPLAAFVKHIFSRLQLDLDRA